MSSSNYIEPVARLLTFGDAGDMDDWYEYLDFGFTSEHVPELIRMAQDMELHQGDPEDDAVWAPVHAWRTLAVLKAEEAIAPLLELLAPLDEIMDEYASDDFPRVFTLIGKGALQPTMEFFMTDAPNFSTRLSAGEILMRFTQRYPETVPKIKDIFIRRLSMHEQNDPEFNGHLVWYLMDLEAVEAEQLIKEAYEAGHVFPGVCGELDAVLFNMGLSDVPPKKKSGGDMGMFFNPSGHAKRPRQNAEKARKNKRKQQKKSRKARKKKK